MRIQFGRFDSRRNSVADHVRELFSFRELVWRLAAKDLKVRYKDSFLGFLWSLLNPLLMMAVFTIVFTILLAQGEATKPAWLSVTSDPRTSLPALIADDEQRANNSALPAETRRLMQEGVARERAALAQLTDKVGFSTLESVPSDIAQRLRHGNPEWGWQPNPALLQQIHDKMQSNFKTHHYPAFILIGLLAWNFTAGTVAAGLAALTDNASIIKKVYFPRTVLPLSVTLATLINFLLALVVLVVVLLVSGVHFFYPLLALLPVVIVFHCLFLAGLAFFLSAITVRLRDMAVIIDVLLQAWFFATPVFYDMQQVYSDNAIFGIRIQQVVYWLNPMASFIETYRNILFNSATPAPPSPIFLTRMFVTALLVFVGGFLFFVRSTRRIGESL